jgi:hypothetical protein
MVEERRKQLEQKTQAANKFVGSTSRFIFPGGATPAPIQTPPAEPTIEAASPQMKTRTVRSESIKELGKTIKAGGANFLAEIIRTSVKFSPFLGAIPWKQKVALADKYTPSTEEINKKLGIRPYTELKPGEKTSRIAGNVVVEGAKLIPEFAVPELAGTKVTEAISTATKLNRAKQVFFLTKDANLARNVLNAGPSAMKMTDRVLAHTLGQAVAGATYGAQRSAGEEGQTTEKTIKNIAGDSALFAMFGLTSGAIAIPLAARLKSSNLIRKALEIPEIKITPKPKLFEPEKSAGFAKLPEIGKKEIPDELKPLAQEARKYKSAEEFVRGQGTPVYHGTRQKFDTFSMDKMGTGKGYNEIGIWFTKDKREADAIAEFTAKGKYPNTKEVYIQPKNKLVVDVKGDNVFGLQGGPNKILKDAKTNGYDAVEFKNVYLQKGETTSHIASLDLNNIKTKSQLTDIYNQKSRKHRYIL